jgi:V/A-type H+-transporting ATPase subunit C
MEQYAYAVSRIKAREAFLLSMQDLEQVLSSDTIEEAKRVLSDKGFDGNGEVKDTEELLKKETEKIWSFNWELVEDKSVFDVFLLRNDYHNLKAALKADYMNLDMDSLYLDYGTVDKNVIKKAVKDKDALMLPEDMRETYEKAQSVLLKTGD